jgi:hypothetical protein
VELALLGDADAVIRRLRPVVQLLGGSTAAARLDHARSREDLERIVQGLHPALGAEELLDQARSLASDRDIGTWLYGRIGSPAQLDRFNAALAALGNEYQPIRNGKVLKEEFEDHRRDLRVPLRALARSVAADGTEYERIRDAIDQVELGEALGTSLWSLPFHTAAALLLDACPVPPRLRAALTDCGDVLRFVAELEHASPAVEPAVDPAAVHAANEQLCCKLLDQVARAAIVWCQRNKVTIGGWADTASSSQAMKSNLRAGRGFLDGFDEPGALAHVRSSLRASPPWSDGAHEPFWKALDRAASVEELLRNLEIAPEDLERAADALRHEQEVARRKRRMHPIAGKEFDTGEENLASLYEHICGAITEVAPLDLSATSALAKARSHGHAGSRGRSGKPTHVRPRYASSELRNAIGLAGEIHVYRWLVAKYGAGVVGPECWLSSLGAYVFPSKQVDDGAGCDFRLKLPSGVTVHLEVKATPGVEEHFVLESSETALARAVLAKRRRRKEVFQILHVLETFSAQPVPVLLPNPYDPNQNVFRIDDAGVRVRYRRAGAEQELE